LRNLLQDSATRYDTRATFVAQLCCATKVPQQKSGVSSALQISCHRQSCGSVGFLILGRWSHPWDWAQTLCSHVLFYLHSI